MNAYVYFVYQAYKLLICLIPEGQGLKKTVINAETRYLSEKNGFENNGFLFMHDFEKSGGTVNI